MSERLPYKSGFMSLKKLSVFFIAFFVGALINQIHSQTLTFKIKGLPDTTVYLVKYYGPGLYFADTTKSSKGLVQFDGSKHVSGMYAVLLPGQKYFEFVHDQELVEILVTDLVEPMASVVVKKSLNNIIFYDYIRFMNVHKTQLTELNTKLMAFPEGSGQRDSVDAEIKRLNQKIAAYQNDILATHGTLFISDLIRLTTEIQLPDFPRDAQGNVTDSAFVYNYYIAHFWDGVDLTDPRLVNSPVYHNKLNLYFSPQGLMQNPDTIIKYSYLLLEKMNQTDQSNYMFQYSLHHIIYKYDTMRIVGMERVFWYLSENYYCPPNAKAYWMSEESLRAVCEANEKVGRILLGNPAIPLILPDTTEKNWINFYDIEAEYTILYFWDPNCGHCKSETPLLQMLYEKKLKARGIEIYAVAQATGEEFDAWKKFIVEKQLTFINVGLTTNIYNQAMKDPTALLEHTTLESLNYGVTYDIYITPSIFVLDKDKKIIYKEINVYQLEFVMDYFTGHQNDAKLLK